MARKASSKKAQRERMNKTIKTTSRAETDGAGLDQALLSNTSSASTAPDNTTPGDGIAATKVFGTTELLEQILLLTAQDRISGPNYLPLSHRPAGTLDPRPHFFLLQRVNKDFYGTINGSIKLKRLMFLAPHKNHHLQALTADLRLALPYHEPIFWLLHKIKDKSITEDLLDWDLLPYWLPQAELDSGIPRPTILMHGSDYSPVKGRFEEVLAALPQGWLNPEASWRKIKVCNAVEAVPLTLTIEQDSWRTALPEDISRIYVPCLLQGEDTLGYLFDLFHELFQERHKRRAATLEIEVKRESLEDEKWDTQDEWLDNLKEARKAGTEKTHYAMVEEQKALWIEREDEILAEEKGLNEEWESWKSAVLREQDEKFHKKQGSGTAQES
ncbi:hypothetical protein CB0940_09221 [Cercospora beticola]|uniref:Uncharacterized protein n=1 Tax=Cercospora beticola TaxID=122368 RepID=A0A2G5HHR1_CERBT|nr:hypothetical protein CB0940_09221 [Cercospora beticola]PIA92069.1 hypothetical protein CB0940_09221 [Cercospora beticola]WPB06475.1 hypothetical protein RHO25_011132 [Cercospora beticola]